MRARDIMFSAQQSAGGQFRVCEISGVPENEVWMISSHNTLMSKLTFNNWSQYESNAEALAEAVEFVSRKKRDFVCGFWVNPKSMDEFKETLASFEEDWIAPEEYVDDESA